MVGTQKPLHILHSKRRACSARNAASSTTSARPRLTLSKTASHLPAQSTPWYMCSRAVSSAASSCFLIEAGSDNQAISACGVAIRISSGQQALAALQAGWVQGLQGKTESLHTLFD